MTGNIPKVLHQTWRTAELPTSFKAFRESWLNHHRGWQHQIYDDDRIHRIIRDRLPGWMPTFEALPLPIMRADFFRYLIVFLDGGLYADIDTISYQPCDELLEGAGCVLGTEMRVSRSSRIAFGYTRPTQIANFIFAATPEHPFLGSIIESVARRATSSAVRDDFVQETTGPRMFTRTAYSFLEAQPHSIKILPRINWNAPLELPRIGLLAKSIYVRHVRFGTWRTENLAWRRFALGLRRSIAIVN